jgi:hypothetical protein
MRRLSWIAVGIALTSSSAAFAAESVPSNPNILQAIQQLQLSIQQLQLNDTQETAVLGGIQASLTNVQTSLTGIQSALQALSPSLGNVLYTPPFPAGIGAALTCSFVNRSSQPVSVTVTVADTNGASVATNPFVNIPSDGVASVAAAAAQSGGYCRFTIQSGARDAIAAGGQLRAATGELTSLPAN